MSRLHFKWRTILPVAICLLVGISILVTFVGISFSSTVIADTRAESQDLAKRFANRVNIGMSSVLSATRGMSTLLEQEVAAGKVSRVGWTEALKVIMNDNPYIQGVYLYFEPNAFDGLDEQYRSVDYHDSSGNFAPYVASYNGSYSISTVNKNEHQKSGFYQAVQNGNIHFSDPVDKNGKMVATAVVPIRVNSRIIGFVASEMNFTYVANILASEKMTAFPHAFVQVISPNGTYVAHTLAEYIGKNTYDISSTEVKQLFRDVLIQKQLVSADSYSAIANEVCTYIAAPVNILENAEPWIASVAVPHSDSNAPVFNTILGALIVVGSVVILTLALLYVTVNISGKSLTEMNDRLFNATRSVLSAATQISGSGEILAQGGVEQAASIEETSATANQTATMIQQNTESTAQVASLAGEAVEAANEGLIRVEDLITAMRELETSSEEIAKIIAIIDNIAFQTSILALNASVEAARVGDAGKGFSVVAEEVRNLANRSTEAASNTSAIVERNLLLSRQGVIGSTEVSQALREISAKNTEVNDLVAQISAASQEQLTGISQIHIALSQMEDVTQSNAAVAEENSAAASELEVQAHDLSTIQESLSDVVLGSRAHNEQEQASLNTRQVGRRSNTRSLPSGTRGRLISPDDRIPR